MPIAKTLTIAGSDSSGGAGIQADLKTFQELETFGMSAITAITAQNTLGVHGVYPQSTEAIEAQLDAVLSDIGADGVKTGMLFSAEIIELVAKKVKEYQLKNIVVDPVMIAKGGATLLQQEAIDALKEKLLPVATVITPNLPEAQAILELEKEITNIEEMEEVAKALYELGPEYILLKGGHLTEGPALDLLYDGKEMTKYHVERIDTKHTHGTGCTFAAAIAAELAKGAEIKEAVQVAKDFITAAISDSIQLGSGIGPTNHHAYQRSKRK
ncbi:phosphomethylpyrimidine kinase [Alkalihalobacillus alcalophilus ATCC 27647 = CGMCC 1.3604]|uniref:Hydroxymethylpyrimidine/phosphomethylpyrimidine kinase n=1 Tax=Alkalihalobacillus alcalophilus ATCC 27647 = CGMCC 1.3604 TaxID=1218173 RepID=A0A094YTN4_ALKAL|nr:bifunctional hydroxymethylpyrimidine kinase/phosphomethylpyrimidine kinase [Alkalihalobacillus alcalophilus]KGA96827.1 phosphomethylpyrimidine kinase [Alkalihalobacillus alcalophilus ATCC 27647 = CGMCC 1.3604]MED1561216.1 bifunctional hydroxymethylpyrimidine kinase/phosphomethylpyrimidine kinase [Alkalihalobacillus alcalophilus]THG88855.1 phosphomethylpyrimidine kinase [Alkalihalobacillus alcalophilus ATCC 27647 = CGMCC 1.3604]